MRWSTGSVLVACTIATSCDRQPESTWLDRTPSQEGSRPAKSTSKPSPEADRGKGATSKRCMVPTPEQPPPAVGPASSCPLDPVFGGRTLIKGSVTFPEATGTPTIEVELARSPYETERGLMYRTRMADNAGMLFDFPGRPEVRSFWM